MFIKKSLFICILFTVFIKISAFNENKIKYISLVLLQNSIEQFSYNLTLLNINAETSLTSKITPSKLAYITDIENTDKILIDKFSKYYNKYWLFYINNSSIINEVLETVFDDVYINAIIIPSYLRSEIFPNIYLNNYEIPIFEISDNHDESMISNDIRKNNKNLFFKLRIVKEFIAYPKIYLIILSLFIIFISFITLSIWSHLIKNTLNEYIFNYHNAQKFLPYTQGMLGLTLIFKSISINNNENSYIDYDNNSYYNDNEEDQFSTAILDIIILIMNTIYRSLFWMFVYLFCYGWCISIQTLTNEQSKNCIKLFLIIFIILWLDDTVDKILGNLWIFYISEIKNFLLYMILLLFLIRLIKKNISFLERKYYYSLLLIPGFTNVILFKINLIKKLRISLFSFYIFYFLVLLINKFLLSNYNSNFLGVTHYIIPYLCSGIIFMILLRPRVLPENYDVGLGNILSDENGNIYKCKLPKFNLMVEGNYEDLLTKEKSFKIKEEIGPIIVLGPNKNYFDYYENFIINNNIETTNSENDINKYFKGLNVGFQINENDNENDNEI